MKSSKTSTPKCFHCELKRHRFVEDGVAFHSFKQSNGYDYDHYCEPCGNQTPEGLKTYRKQSLASVRQKINGVKSTLQILEANADGIKKAVTVGGIMLALRRVEPL